METFWALVNWEFVAKNLAACQSFFAKTPLHLRAMLFR